MRYRLKLTGINHFRHEIAVTSGIEDIETTANYKPVILASSQSKIFHLILRLIRKKSFLGKQLATGTFRFSCPEPPARITRKLSVTKYQVLGRNVFTLRPENPGSLTHILYLHGGAYVQGFVRFHWSFLAYLIQETRCTVTAPDYPLAPDFTCQDSFAMVLQLYRQLLLTVRPENLIIMGDSAGGGFALGLAQVLRDESLPQPGQLILLSPWLDITLTNPEIALIAPGDPFLEQESLRKAGKLYAGDIPPDHPMLSPINGPLAGLGKLSIFAGSNDILVADTRKLHLLAMSQHIQHNYYEYPQMVHAWMLLNLPESMMARAQIIHLILQG